ncbi:MAG: MarR family transcriptional regulator [Oscillospiraceae bacterium]|nr:MarR family transcriptional regulator [Oscillospiraceae bacterium]
MLYDSIAELYDRLRLLHYGRLFSRIREREGSLSATEAFSVDAIYLLGEPTIKQFSDFLGISQPNATYKVANLTEKGYVKKMPSEEDRREYRLRVSDKFYGYYGDGTLPIAKAAEKLSRSFTEEELGAFERVLTELNQCLKEEEA